MYAICAAAEGAKVIEVPTNNDFAFPTQELLDQVNPRTRFIAIANPNNPTGSVAAHADLIRIVQEAPQAAVLIDEAYFEFHGESLIDQVGCYPSLFVARTFSKAYGLAGLRAGVLTGDAEQMATVRRVASPYNVNAAALAVLPAAVADQLYVRTYLAEVLHNRMLLERTLDDLGLRHWPSQANFVLVHVGRRHEDFVRSMSERGVLVRDRSNDPGCDGCVRMTVGTDKDMRILLPALQSVVEELGLRSEARA